MLLCTGVDYLERAKLVEAECNDSVGQISFDLRMVELASVVDYQEILIKVTELLARVREHYGHRSPRYEVLLDPGTPQMQTVWFILVQRGVVDATLLQGVPPHLAGGSYRVKEIDPGPLISRAYEDTERARAPSPSKKRKPLIIGESRALRDALEMARNAAAYDLPILIRGETGSGKELVARLIHAESPRASEPFAPFNCSTIPEGLAESTLFGHLPGAFTDARTKRLGVFRSADGGTLFLDEIGDLPLAVQPKLLRVLEEKLVTPVGSDKPVPVDLRLLSATNRPLEELLEDGTFRQDLLSRVGQVVIEIPPLRERREDIPLLVDHILNGWNDSYGENRRVSKELLKVLMEYRWPGNVRELEGTLRQICATQSSRELTPEVLPPAIRSNLAGNTTLEVADRPGARSSAGAGPGQASALPFDLPEGGIDLKAYLFQIEKHYYDLARSRSANYEEAAKLLGLKGPAYRKAMRERFGEAD